MEFRPTLIIGLGGSGTFVARRLKKRLFRLVESDIPPSIQILAFDTDRQTPEPLLNELSALEFHWISDFQGDNFVSKSALANQPPLKDWWKYGRLAPGFVKDGAKQKPPVGRLAFFVKFTSIEKQIRDSIQRMFQQTANYVPPPNVNSVDLYVVGSSCGGTGAGMFFDVAILARDLIKSAVRDAILQSHVFLPSCFEGTQADQRSLQTNSFAFFKTMEAMQSEKLPPLKYPSRTIDSPAQSLFNRVHLLGSVNTAGIKLENTQEIFETAALQLDLEISGASGRNMKSAIDNAAANFDVRPHGRLAVYSSYGSAHLTGTPDFGRLAVLPDFVRSISAALVSPISGSNSVLAVQNPSFIKLGAVMTNDTDALELLPGYEALVMKLRNTDDPQKVAAQLTANIDSVLATLSTQWLAALSSLRTDVREAACHLIEGGEQGITKAIQYIEQAKQELSKVLGLTLEAEGGQSEGAGAVVAKMNQFFVRKDTKKTILASEGLPYLRTQALLMVRKSLASKAKADLSAAAGELQSYLTSLQRFGIASAALIATVERESEEKIAAKRNTIGAQSIAVDIDEVKKNFAKHVSTMVSGFFSSPASARSLGRLAEGAIEGKGPDNWGTSLLQAADEFLRANLAEKAAVPSNWYDRAADQIVRCQPLVQFIADHANYGTEGPTKIAIARAYASEGVKEAVNSRAPALNLQQVGDSSEPGSLEVTTVVLNFGLYQLQELRLIEEGYKYWTKTQPEPSENRYAWRGPEPFWKRLQQTGIFPLSEDKQALARVLAFSPIPPGTPVAVQKTEAYVINGQTLDTDPDSTRLEKYREFNRELLSTGMAEKILQNWNDSDPITAKSHAEQLIAKMEARIASASTREQVEDDWQDFLEMIREELSAVKESVRRLPV